MALKALFSFFLFLSCFINAFSARPLEAGECTYTIAIKTGDVKNAGTDSTISLIMQNHRESPVRIYNMVAWGGAMGPGHDYFERNNYDTFYGKASCLQFPVCSITLISDGSGNKPGWFVDYVQISAAGVHTPNYRKTFTISQWLAKDEPPYQLTAARDYCNAIDDELLEPRENSSSCDSVM